MEQYANSPDGALPYTGLDLWVPFLVLVVVLVVVVCLRVAERRANQ